MIEISFEAFLNYLLKFNRIIHGELLINNYTRYKTYYIMKPSNIKYFYVSGFVSNFTVFSNPNNSKNIYCYLHQVSNDCDFNIAIDSCKKIITEEKSENKCLSSELHVFVTIEMAKKFQEYIDTYMLSKYGKKCELNGRIRHLSIKNMNEVNTTCKQHSMNDTNFGKREAEYFINYDWSGSYNAMGYYVNSQLVGIASYIFSEELNIAELDNIYIVPEFRNKGIGKELVYAVNSMYPEKLWLYQAGIKNESSLNLALSTGFSFVGAQLWIKS